MQVGNFGCNGQSLVPFDSKSMFGSVDRAKFARRLPEFGLEREVEEFASRTNMLSFPINEHVASRNLKPWTRTTLISCRFFSGGSPLYCVESFLNVF